MDRGGVPRRAGREGRATAPAVHRQGFDPLAKLHPAAQIRRIGRLVLAAEEVREPLERGVDAGAVQALGVVLDDQLPVGGDVVDDPVAQAELLHAPGAKPRGQVGELVVQAAGEIRRGSGRCDRPRGRPPRVAAGNPPCGNGADRPSGARPPAGRRGRRPRRDRGSGSGRRSVPSRGLAKPRAAVAADVVIGPDAVLIGTGDDHALAGHVAEHVVADAGIWSARPAWIHMPKKNRSSSAR